MITNVYTWFLSHIALRRDESGQAMVEYALIIALVAIVVIVALSFLGHSVGNTMDTIGNKIGNSTTPAG